MVQALLTQTTLQVRIDKVKEPAFETNIGTPQDDSLSPILFNCYYEAAMRDLRPRFPALPQEDACRGLPSETQYADDLDFLSFAQQHLEQVLEVCSDQLPDWSLQVNRDKTECTHIYLAPKGSPD